MKPKKKTESQARKRGVCCQCRGKYQRAMIWVHLKHCDCRMVDARFIHCHYDNAPSAFFLMLTSEAHPDFWVCLEAHVNATFADLEAQIVQLIAPGLSPEEDESRFLFSQEIAERNGWDRNDDSLDTTLEKVVRTGDRFYYYIGPENPLLMTIQVVEEVGTSFLHRPIDVVAHFLAEQPQPAKTIM
ncbi:MAG TPA: hypothetical protein PLP42_04870 [Acidobacteriota bacterium]|nr:hypothetical protein [Acidobacteriota bacterium]